MTITYLSYLKKMFIEMSQFYIKTHFAYFLQQTDMARNMNSNPKGPNILITGM